MFNVLPSSWPLRCLTFSKRKAFGVIAQELETIIPETVSINNQGNKTVSYNHIIAFLIEAVKELNVKIDVLKQDIKK